MSARQDEVWFPVGSAFDTTDGLAAAILVAVADVAGGASGMTSQFSRDCSAAELTEQEMAVRATTQAIGSRPPVAVASAPAPRSEPSGLGGASRAWRVREHAQLLTCAESVCAELALRAAAVSLRAAAEGFAA